MKRYAAVLKVNDVKKYRELHKNVPGSVLKVLRNAGISNYSIFLKDDLLFSYFEYAGSDHEEDYNKMRNEPVMHEWQELCTPLQVPLDTRAEGEWWAFMESVFYME